MTRHRRYRMRRKTRLRLRAPAITLFLLALPAVAGRHRRAAHRAAVRILHESAHALVYRKLWHRWPDLTLSPFGICLQLRGVPDDTRRRTAAGRRRAAGKPAGRCTVLLYMQTAGRYSYGGYWFACTNLLVGGANLLPLPGLDGAHILHGMFYSLDKRHRI